MEPLAYKMKPKCLDDVLGQDHLLGKDGFIRKMVENKKPTSVILYGAPGSGKSSIANAICCEMHLPYAYFDSANENKARLAEIINEAKLSSSFILVIDEIHRMNKNIQDYLLPFLENGTITLIGLTTQNPYHAINPPIRSRSLIFKLNPLTNKDLDAILARALAFYKNDISIADDAREYILSNSNHDVRMLINFLENILNTSKNKVISLDDAKSVIKHSGFAMDKNADNFYATLSAFHKSVRGSDVDASLHYLARLLKSGDLTAVTRRLKMIAYEDIGLANPLMGPKVKAACDVALEVGMPEAATPLGVIVCEMALSPKSNTGYLAIKNAISALDNTDCGPIPSHLKNVYDFDAGNKKYLYPHDFPNAWVKQDYLPDKIKDAQYFFPKDETKMEKAFKERYLSLKKK